MWCVGGGLLSLGRPPLFIFSFFIDCFASLPASALGPPLYAARQAAYLRNQRVTLAVLFLEKLAICIIAFFAEQDAQQATILATSSNGYTTHLLMCARSQSVTLQRPKQKQGQAQPAHSQEPARERARINLLAPNAQPL